MMNERANLVDNTAGSERIDVDKLQNSQEADRTEQGKMNNHKLQKIFE